jgi:peptide/nickel transport system permease protein
VLRYVGGRLVQAVVVILLVATLTFVLLHLAPGDPFSAASESPYVPRELVEQQRHAFGLDRPVPEQYARYLANLARGNLGYSFSQHRSVRDAFRDALPNTLLLTCAALIVDFLLGIGLGVAQGKRRGTVIDQLTSLGMLALYSTPVFWLGHLFLVFFGEKLGWLPVGGTHDLVTWGAGSVIARTLDSARHLLLPAVTLGLVGAAATARYQRAQLVEVLHQDYLRTARAKGLGEHLILWSHALRNALLPTITLLGLSLPALLSGATLIETVYAWPGMGLLTVQAITRRDYFLVTSAAVLAGTIVVLANLAADLLTHVADPRTRDAI